MGRRSVLRLFAWIGMALLMAPSSSAADGTADSRTITISAIVNEQTHAIAKTVLREAYRHIGLTVRFNDLPGQRALEWANNGLTDGDAARIWGSEKKYPNLIPVKTPVVYFTGIAFAKHPIGNIERWEDLKGMRIGIVRGIRYSVIGTRGMDPFPADDMTHLFTLLDKGRIEVAVAVLEAGKIEIEKHFKGKGIHSVGRPLHSAPLYHFINKRNKEIVPELDSVLREMTRTGEMERLWRQAVEELTRQ